MYKPYFLAGGGHDDAHMAHDPHRAVSPCKQDQVAGFGLLQVDRALHRRKVGGLPGNDDAEMIKYIRDKPRAVKTFGRVGRGVFIRYAGERAGESY